MGRTLGSLHQAHVTAAAHAQGNVVAFLGDSITKRWVENTHLSGQTGITQWEQWFGRWIPLNLGIGGDRIQDAGWRLQHGLLSSPSLNVHTLHCCYTDATMLIHC
jgi:hypothetical protein